MPSAWNLLPTAAWPEGGVARRQVRSALRTASFAAATSAGEGVRIGSGYAEGGGGTAGPLLGPAGSVFADASSTTFTPTCRIALTMSSTLSRPGVQRRSRKLWVETPSRTAEPASEAESGIPASTALPKSRLEII